MKSNFLKVIISLMFLFTLKTQSQEARFTSPDDEETNVSVNTQLTINTNMRIDTTKINFQKNIMVITEDIYNNQPDTSWHLLNQFGDAELVNDTTINFYCSSMTTLTKYYAIIDSLQVINNQNDTLLCPRVTISFTTQLPPFKLLETTLGHGFLKCTDTLFFQFNRKIDSLTTYLGDMIDILKISSKFIVDSNRIEETLAKIETSMWFNNDSTQIYVLPLNLSSDTNYYARTNVAYLSGDSSDNNIQHFQVSGNYQLHLLTTGVDYKLPPYDADTLTAGINDTVRIYAYKYYNGKKFVKWVCLDDPAIDNDTSLALTIIKDCSSLKDLNISAEYQIPAKDTVTISGSTNGTVKVYDYLGNLLGHDSTYLIDNAPWGFLRVVFEPNTGYKFTSWTCNYPPLNGDPSRDVNIGSAMDCSYSHIFFDPNTSPSLYRYSLTVVVQFANGGIGSRYDDAHLIQNFINVTPAMTIWDPNGTWMKTTISSMFPFSQDVVATINPDDCDCYRIVQVSGDVTGTFKDDYCTGGPQRTSWSISNLLMDDQNPNRTVTIQVDRKLLKVEYELVVENSRKLINDKMKALIYSEPFYPPYSGCELIEGRLEEHQRDDYKEYYRYSSKCHSSYWIKTRYSNDYYKFKTYNTTLGYYGGSTPTELEMLLDPACIDYDIAHSRKIQAILKDEFKLLNIYKQKSDHSWEYYNSFDFIKRFNYNTSGYLIDPGLCYLDPNENTVILKFEFNRDVDRTTVENTFNLMFQEQGSRLDFPVSISPRFAYHPNTTDNNFQWIDNKTVSCTLKTKSGNNWYGITKYQIFDLTVSPNIKDTDGDLLSNPISNVRLLSEYPTLYVTSTKFKLLSDAEWPVEGLGCEVLSHFFTVQNDPEHGTLLNTIKTPMTGDYWFVNLTQFGAEINCGTQINEMQIGSYKNQGAYSLRYGTIWFEIDDGDIYADQATIFQAYRDKYNDPNCTWFKNNYLGNGMYQVSFPYRYNWWNNDDEIGFGPAGQGVGQNDRLLHNGNRWGTESASNGSIEKMEVSEPMLNVFIKYELK